MHRAFVIALLVMAPYTVAAFETLACQGTLAYDCTSRCTFETQNTSLSLDKSRRAASYCRGEMCDERLRLRLYQPDQGADGAGVTGFVMLDRRNRPLVRGIIDAHKMLHARTSDIGMIVAACK